LQSRKRKKWNLGFEGIACVSIIIIIITTIVILPRRRSRKKNLMGGLKLWGYHILCFVFQWRTSVGCATKLAFLL